MKETRFNAEIGTLLPSVELRIGGKDRQLAFDMASIVLVEKMTGLNLMQAAIGDISATTIRALLYAALLPHEPELKLETVTAWIRPGNMPVIREAVLAAWFESIPEPKADAKAGKDEAGAASSSAS